MPDKPLLLPPCCVSPSQVSCGAVRAIRIHPSPAQSREIARRPTRPASSRPGRVSAASASVGHRGQFFDRIPGAAGELVKYRTAMSTVGRSREIPPRA